MPSDQSLHASLAAHGLAHLHARIATTGVPCVNFDAGEAEEVPVGASKLGGLPDLAPNTSWPRRGQRPLMFLAQINLSDLPDVQGLTGVPPSGLLSLWYDTADEPWGDGREAEGFRVLHTASPADQLLRTELPEFEPDGVKFPNWPWQPFTECPLRITGSDCYDFESVVAGVERQEGPEVARQLEDAISEHLRDSPQHRLLGRPDAIQNDMAEELEDDTGRDGWTLLFQLDTDEDGPGWMWGDAGRLYYWIRKQDLARADFSQVRGRLQCS